MYPQIKFCFQYRMVRSVKNGCLFQRISVCLSLCLFVHSTVSLKDCDNNQKCENAIESTNLFFYGSTNLLLSYHCFDARVNDTPSVTANTVQVDVRNFKPKSSWLGAYLVDMHGVALSPLFRGHGNLSCTEYVISQVEADRIALEMKHYSSDKVDFRFDFNASGWIQYNKRYGCAKESPQVDNTRIIDTDYENYIIVQSCVGALADEGTHRSGYLVLVKPETVTDTIWDRVKMVFTGLSVYDIVTYVLPDPNSLIKARPTECEGSKVKVIKNPLCPKKRNYAMLVNQREVVLEFRQMKRRKAVKVIPGQAVAYDRRLQEDYVVPIEQLSCMVTMFISMTLALYWTHFSF